MKYYKVKPEFDNKHVSADYFLVGNELYTPAELRRLESRYNRYYRTPLNFHRMFEEVEVSKRDVYFFFDARYSDSTGSVHESTPCFSR